MDSFCRPPDMVTQQTLENGHKLLYVL